MAKLICLRLFSVHDFFGHPGRWKSFSAISFRLVHWMMLVGMPLSDCMEAMVSLSLMVVVVVVGVVVLMWVKDKK